MLHLIAYDIASDKRLRMVAKLCEDYGVRVEKSVFECHLSGAEFAELWERLADIVADGDSVVDYPIGLLDQKKIQSLGCVRHHEHESTHVF